MKRILKNNFSKRFAHTQTFSPYFQKRKHFRSYGSKKTFQQTIKIEDLKY